MMPLTFRKLWPCKWIKLTALLFFGPLLFAAAPLPSSSPSPLEPEAVDSPQIEVHTFEVTVAKVNKSNTVFLFQNPKGMKQPVGKIIMFFRGNEPIMASRVVHIYLNKRQFAVLALRFYGETRTMISPGDVLNATSITEVVAAPIVKKTEVQVKNDFKRALRQEEKEEGQSELPGEVLEEGKILFSKSEYSRALKRIRKARELDETLLSAWLLEIRTLLLLKQKEQSKAISQLFIKDHSKFSNLPMIRDLLQESH